MNTGNSRTTHKHSHTHGVVKLVNLDVQKVIAKDALLAQDRSAYRAQFQGRFRKTSSGDRKNRTGYSPEMRDAQVEDHEREDIKIEQAAQAEAIASAAADAGVLIETPTTDGQSESLTIDYDLTDLRRLVDDGGPAHD